MNILAVIPARGGSKGVPGKNIRLLGGKPLIAYSIEAALAVEDMLYEIVVSTDSAKIGNTARNCGAVYHSRPLTLAGDDVPMLPVIRNVMDFYEWRDGVTMDWILLLQPTTPFRSADDIRAAIALAHDCDSVISVVKVESHHPALMKRIEGDRLLPYCIEEVEGTRRQDYSPPAYMRNGAIYLTRRDVLMGGSIWGKVTRPLIMPEERSINIDTEGDFLLAEAMLNVRN